MLKPFLCFLTGVLISLTTGCGRSQREESLTIFVSGDTAGWITPCGCAANQSGGLARRATLIGQAGDAGETLYLDAGGSAAGTNEYQQIKLTSILRGMKDMELAVHNIGGPEAQFDADQLAELAHKSGITWVSANLQPNGGETPAVDHIVCERNGARVAVTGVVDPEVVTASAWTARDPVASVLDALRDVPADVRIVLAYCDAAKLRLLAESLPEVDFIVGGPTGQALSPAVIGPVTILSATNKGKFLAKIEMTRGGEGRFETTSVGPAEVKAELAEDATQLANLKSYYAALAERDFRVDEAGLASVPKHANYQIAGSKSCAECHAAEDTKWNASKHCHAWEVLTARGAQVDPYCQQCHTTGYGYDGGFVSIGATPHVVHVGCENCHGPSSAHVANPKVRTPFASREQCIRCHDHENSPSFHYDSYWDKIRHGEKTADPSSAAASLQ